MDLKKHTEELLSEFKDVQRRQIRSDLNFLLEYNNIEKSKKAVRYIEFLSREFESSEREKIRRSTSHFLQMSGKKSFDLEDLRKEEYILNHVQDEFDPHEAMLAVWLTEWILREIRNDKKIDQTETDDCRPELKFSIAVRRPFQRIRRELKSNVLPGDDSDYATYIFDDDVLSRKFENTSNDEIKRDISYLGPDVNPSSILNRIISLKIEELSNRFKNIQRKEIRADFHSLLEKQVIPSEAVEILNRKYSEHGAQNNSSSSGSTLSTQKSSNSATDYELQKKNGYPENWDKLRRQAYNRDDYRCQNCGVGGGPKGDVELHAHHIVPISGGGNHTLSNLSTLCATCHSLIHDHLD